MHSFERRLSLPIPAEAVFAWHHRPGAFERLAPSWQELELVSQSGGTIEDGARLHFRVHQGPVALDWVARHEGFVEGRRFVDVAERSPFRRWVHTHSFIPDGEGGGSTLRDAIELELPLDRLSWPLAGWGVEAMLERMFRQRHLRTVIDLRRHWAVRERGSRTLRIVGHDPQLRASLQGFWTTGGNDLAGTDEACDAVVELALDDLAKPAVAPRSLAPGGCLIRVVGPRTSGSQVTPCLALARKHGARIVTLETGLVVRSAEPLAMLRRRSPGSAGGDRGWIDIEDLIGLIHHAIYDESVVGQHWATHSRAGALAEVFEFTTLERSLEHRAGREDAGAIERALGRWPRERTQAPLGVLGS